MSQTMPPQDKRRSLIQALATAGVLGPAGICGLISEALAEGNKPIAPGMHKIVGTVTGERPTGQRRATDSQRRHHRHRGEKRGHLRDRPGRLHAAGKKARSISLPKLPPMSCASLPGKFFQCSEKAIRSWWYQPQPSAFAAPVAISRLKQRPPTSAFAMALQRYRRRLIPSSPERIETKHHDHPILIHNDSAMPMMAPASVINHTDAELILLENLVGRWPAVLRQDVLRLLIAGRRHLEHLFKRGQPLCGLGRT
jgi:hypothetical protein